MSKVVQDPLIFTKFWKTMYTVIVGSTKFIHGQVSLSTPLNLMHWEFISSIYFSDIWTVITDPRFKSRESIYAIVLISQLTSWASPNHLRFTISSESPKTVLKPLIHLNRSSGNNIMGFWLKLILQCCFLKSTTLSSPEHHLRFRISCHRNSLQ